MQALHAAFGIGSVVSPLLVGGAGASEAYLVFGAISSIPFIGLLSQDAILKALSSRRADDMIEPAGQDIEGMEPAQEPATETARIPWRIEVIMCAAFFLYVGTEVSFGGWLVTVLLEEGLASSKRKAAYSVSIFWGAITFGKPWGSLHFLEYYRHTDGSTLQAST